MYWIQLLLAGLFECLWATTMKLSNGFTKLNFTLYTILAMVISFGLLAKATKTLPLSVAYPIWTGIGAVGSIVIGVTLFDDRLSMKTCFFVGLLLLGIIGIKITSSH
ncbi:MAG: DMT family transporter [Enterococcus sp.]